MASSGGPSSGSNPGAQWQVWEDQQLRTAFAAGANIFTIRDHFPFPTRSNTDLLQRAMFLGLNLQSGFAQAASPQQFSQPRGFQNQPSFGQHNAPSQHTGESRGSQHHSPYLQGSPSMPMQNLGGGHPGSSNPDGRSQGTMQGSFTNQPGRFPGPQRGIFSGPDTGGSRGQHGVTSYTTNVGNLTQSFHSAGLGSTIPSGTSRPRFTQPPQMSTPQAPQKLPVSTRQGHVRNQTSYPPLPSMSQAPHPPPTPQMSRSPAMLQAQRPSDPQTLLSPTAADVPLPPAIPEVSDNIPRNSTPIYTCIVQRSYESPGTISLDMNAGQNTMSILKGQQGFIYGPSAVDPRGDTYIQFNLANTNRVGWVPKASLEIGTPKREIKLISVDWITKVVVEEASTRLEKTLDALFSTVEHNKSRIRDEGGFMATIDHLCGDHAKRYRTTIVSRMPVRIRETIENGRYSFSKLWDLPDSSAYTINPMSENVGIYTILVRDINGENLIYHGKSVNVGARFCGHRTGLRKNSTVSGQLYTTCRQRRHEQDWKMLMWTDFSNDPITMHPKLLQVGEFASVVLDKSWAPALFNLKAETSYILDKNHAELFSTMADAIFAETKWEPITDCIGGNWQTPLMDSDWKTTTWVRQDVILESGNTINVYRRGPLRALQQKVGQKELRRIRLFSGGTDQRGTVWISSTQLPMQVDIYPVIEYYNGENQRHPFPAFNVSEPGPTSDWLELNRVGVYFQWRDSQGQWKFFRWQSLFGYDMLGWSAEAQASIPNQHKEAFNHAIEIYVKARLIIDTIKQVEYSNAADLWPWIKIGPSIIVKFVTYDHLQQTLTLEDQVPLSRVAPTLRTYNENMKFIIYHYREPAGTLFIGTAPPGAGPVTTYPNLIPAKCISCLGEANSTRCGNLPEISQGPVENQRKASCTKCNRYRRPCAWILGMQSKERGMHPKYYWLGNPTPMDLGIKACLGPSPTEMVTFLKGEADDEL